ESSDEDDERDIEEAEGGNDIWNEEETSGEDDVMESEEDEESPVEDEEQDSSGRKEKEPINKQKKKQVRWKDLKDKQSKREPVKRRLRQVLEIEYETEGPVRSKQKL
ncbi:unnamed protein product, partial [Onchocerca ochengi]